MCATLLLTVKLMQVTTYKMKYNVALRVRQTICYNIKREHSHEKEKL